jgi:hypothetical protein
MNSNTKEALDKLADAVEKLAYGTVHIIGAQAASEVVNAVRQLQYALNHDETIIESK